MKDKFNIKTERNIALQVDGGKPINFADIQRHKMKRLVHLPPKEFLIALINSMEISVQEGTEVYKKWPQMFEEAK